jgi:hypothetical protein
MIHVFGDSFTYGHNFDNSIRETLVYPTLISKHLNQPVKNYAIPGGSNWRIARQLESIELSSKDIVIISWTDVTRFELGVSENHYIPPIKKNAIGDLVEYEDNLITKRFFEQLTERTTDNDAKIINNLVYTQFNNELWFEKMFKLMYNSCLYKLETSGCEWLMFNAWNTQCEQSYHKNYIYSDTTMNTIIGNKHIEYWGEKEHQMVSKILLKHLSSI